MPTPDHPDTPEAQLAAVRRTLLDAAAFGKTLPPTTLEHLAARLADAQRRYATRTPPRPHCTTSSRPYRT
ncbi:DUF6374 family protein [Nocardia takedensis]